jgi:hypothetical protein
MAENGGEKGHGREKYFLPADQSEGSAGLSPGTSVRQMLP